MDNLTFAEQVKIILGRKGMTIKELASLIEERTGKKMSRQNLTQRLGRDNFQEQDMRLIASILDCPFHLSIMDTKEEVLEPVEKLDTAKAKDVVEVFEATEENTEEVDMTIGELCQMHEELDEIAEKEGIDEDAELEEAKAEAVKEVVAEVEEQVVESVEEEKDTDTKEVVAEEKQTEELKEVRRGGTVFLRRKEDSILKSEHNDEKHEEESKEITEDSASFEPIVKHNDEKEDREKGDINPYTRKEYQSNSVRMHPSRIGYVQVYDRKTHKWTDMTEWAFLGYQERKKKLLGAEYEPPIYLD